jgi:acylphosphatase
VPTERFEIVGRVQGVGFRWFVRQHARALNIAGWVRNLPSGDVELLASGTAEQLNRLEELVRGGPPGSRVERVTRSPLSDETTLEAPFTISR